MLNLFELLLAIPDESVGPLLATHPVANIVLVSAVDEDWNPSIEKGSQMVSCRFHHIKGESQVGSGGALFPEIALLGWDTHERTVLVGVQELPQMVIRVAQAHADARLSNIIDVEGREAR